MKIYAKDVEIYIEEFEDGKSRAKCPLCNEEVYYGDGHTVADCIKNLSFELQNFKYTAERDISELQSFKHTAERDIEELKDSVYRLEREIYDKVDK